MSASLVVLCLAAFALVAVPISGVVALSLPWLDGASRRLSPRQRARLWLGLAALPSVLGGLAVGASLLPALGVGHDHCLAHGLHHPHLCTRHLGGAPGVLLVLVALLPTARLLRELVELLRGFRRSRETVAALAQASDLRADVRVFPTDEAHAFVLGLLRPRVHVSHGLLALGQDVVEAVLAHERVHARRRDLLWRALFRLAAVGHLPSIAASLGARLCVAQEMAADAEGAESLKDGRLAMAEALLALARVAKGGREPSAGISFVRGDVGARVHALLEEEPTFPEWPARALFLSAWAVPAALGASHDLVHHGLETLLGALS